MADVTVRESHAQMDVVRDVARGARKAGVKAVETVVDAVAEPSAASVPSVAQSAHLALTVKAKTSRVSVWMQTAKPCRPSARPVVATRNAMIAQALNAVRTAQ